MQLSNVTYGAAGPFAISFWVKPTQLLGGGLAYLYSHNATVPGNQSIKPNQVGFQAPTCLVFCSRAFVREPALPRSAIAHMIGQCISGQLQLHICVPAQCIHCLQTMLYATSKPC